MGALQFAPPSTVLMTAPCESVATHTLVVAQWIPVNGLASALALQDWPPSAVE
jgi:hypothetical protein